MILGFCFFGCYFVFFLLHLLFCLGGFGVIFCLFCFGFWGFSFSFCLLWGFFLCVVFFCLWLNLNLKTIKPKIYLIHSSSSVIMCKVLAKNCSNCDKASTLPNKLLKCGGCKNTWYCSVQCQKMDWKKGRHKLVCGQPISRRKVTADVEKTDETIIQTKTSTCVPSVDDDPTNPCPICLSNEDDYGDLGQCLKCGQLFCGDCKDLLGELLKCPTCRALFEVTATEKFMRVFSLVHDRSAGRHTRFAHFNLGVLYQLGQGTNQDNAFATAHFKLAADQGFGHAEYNLGVLFADVRSELHDDALAFTHFTLAARQGFAKAHYNIGLMYQNGRGVQQDDALALKSFTLAAVDGFAKAQFNLGVMYSNGQGATQDAAMAAHYYKLAAAQGLASAQFNLGDMYSHSGDQHDLLQAVTYYTLAADQALADAQCNLGQMYATGQGVTQDDALAFKYYSLAADQGLADGQCNVGLMYESGRGVTQDHALAFIYFKRAADQGHAPAQHNTGTKYDTGVGVEQDQRQACKYFKLAADQGLSDAQYNFGALKFSGEEGVKQDVGIAARYFKLAAHQGQRNALAVLANVFAVGQKIQVVGLVTHNANLNGLKGIVTKALKKTCAAVVVDGQSKPQCVPYLNLHLA